MYENNADLSLFSQDHYLAFVLSEKTRQELIKAIGARFEVRVCHHVTLHYDIPEPGEPTKLDYYMANCHGYRTVGYMVTEHQVVIMVEGGMNSKFRPIYDQTNPRDFLHITYERDRAVKDGASSNVFSNEVPYVFYPLQIELAGDFQMLPKNDKTPTEMNLDWVEAKIAMVAREQKEIYLFTNSYFHGDRQWIAMNIGSDGVPIAFVYRNKSGPGRTVERGNPEFLDLLTAWQEWAVSQLRWHRRSNKQQANHTVTIGREMSMAEQPMLHFVKVRNLLGTAGVWMAEGFSSEGNPLAFIGTSITGVGLEVKMDMTPGSDYMQLLQIWKQSEAPGKRQYDIGWGRQTVELDQAIATTNERYFGYNFNREGFPTMFYRGRLNEPVGDVITNGTQTHLFLQLLHYWCHHNNRVVPKNARQADFNSVDTSNAAERCMINSL